MQTLAHEFLDIERECGFEVSQECYDTLDAVVEKAKQMLNPNDDPRKLLSDIGNLLSEEGFTPKNNGLLSHALETKELDCKDYSVLYYSIAEKLGFSDKLSIVLTKGHAFIRWHDGKNVFNWDARGNAELSDEFYISKLNIHADSIAQEVYLKDVAREESKAIPYYVCGAINLKNKNYDLALACFDKALELNPKDPRSLCGRGHIKGEKLGDIIGGLDDLDESLKLDPNHVRSYYYRAMLKMKFGTAACYESAVNDLSKSIALNPANPDPYYYLAESLFGLGKKEEAKKAMDTYERLRK